MRYTIAGPDPGCGPDQTPTRMVTTIAWSPKSGGMQWLVSGCHDGGSIRQCSKSLIMMRCVQRAALSTTAGPEPAAERGELTAAMICTFRREDRPLVYPRSAMPGARQF